MCTVTVLAPGSGMVTIFRPLARRYSVTPSIVTTFCGVSWAKPDNGTNNGTNVASRNSNWAMRFFIFSEHPVEKVQGSQPRDDRTEGDPEAPCNGDRDDTGQQAFIAQ